MTHMNNHGGACCGMRHIVGMYAGPTHGQTVEQIENEIRRCLAVEGTGRLFEIVLNSFQMNNLEVLDLLRRYGFVLTSSFNNRTGSRCAIFHRADDRIALRDWQQWQGMVINDTLAGPLPRVTHASVPAARPAASQYTVGARVRFINRTSPYFGSTGTICHVWNDWAAHISVEFDEPINSPRHGLRTQARTRRAYLQIITPEQPAAAPEPAVSYQTHVNAPAPAPVVPRLPEPVATLYHNVLRNGRSDAGWPTYQMARAAAPRAQAIDAQVIFSDGTRHWTRAIPEMHENA